MPPKKAAVVAPPAISIDAEFRENLREALSGAMGHSNERFVRKYLDGVIKKLKTYDPNSPYYVDYEQQEIDRNAPPKRYGVCANGGLVLLAPGTTPYIVVKTTSPSSKDTAAKASVKEEKEEEKKETVVRKKRTASVDGKRAAKKTKK